MRRATRYAALSALADKYGAFLYIDEAHATGVLGANGFGLAHGLRNALVMGTFSKGLGGFGAYAACSAVLREAACDEATVDGLEPLGVGGGEYNTPPAGRFGEDGGLLMMTLEPR